MNTLLLYIHATRLKHTPLHKCSNPLPSSRRHAFTPHSMRTDYSSHTSYELWVLFSCFSDQSILHRQTVTLSLPSLLNLSTGEKPRGEEGEAEKREKSRWGRKKETQRAREWNKEWEKTTRARSKRVRRSQRRYYYWRSVQIIQVGVKGRGREERGWRQTVGKRNRK